MSEQPVWTVAALPAAIFGVLSGTFLLSQSLKCAGDLAAILDGETGRTALIPMLRHALTHPLDLLPFALPPFLGVWLLLIANARLRHVPVLAVGVGLFPFIALILGGMMVAPRICDTGPDPLVLAVISGGALAALAAGIFVYGSRRA
ncbi:MAG: hypothetical protein LPK02_10890 [Rhodobacterales bacterium]|nr:hypothetical protein [Rhodobacterales bacterium]MDX5413538.1 hypothetical protein [Rhodobacterales bacterium]